jgi:hypothetical protein
MRIGVHGQHDRSKIRLTLFELADDFEAANRRHRHVEENDIRFEVADRFGRELPVRNDVDDFELVAEEPDETLGDDAMVVDD